MSEHQGTVAGVLIASMFIGFSYERNVGQAAQTRTLQQPHVGAIDHFVPHISTERANKGSRVSLFVRERRGARRGLWSFSSKGDRPLRYPRPISNTELTAG
jgi:hypothetical protein